MAKDFRQKLGRLGEGLACEHYVRLGFQLVVRNYRTRVGELDLVVTDGETIVFCEVKTRTSGGVPWEAVGEKKQRQVRRMAKIWLTESAESGDRLRYRDLRCDVIGVIVNCKGELLALDHLEGAF